LVVANLRNELRPRGPLRRRRGGCLEIFLRARRQCDRRGEGVID